MRVLFKNGRADTGALTDAPADHVTDQTLSCTDDLPPLRATIEGARSDSTRYVIEGEIARGGLGRILRAHDEHLDRPVAVKELLSQSAVLRDRFRREVAITARLQHPAIV